MTLPIRTTLEDIIELCEYLSTKPTGATIKEAKSVLDKKRLDTRKINAMIFWGLIEEENNRLKLTPEGRECSKGEAERIDILSSIIRRIPPYTAIIERTAHRHEDSLSTVDVGAHWHDHFKSDVSESERVLKDQAVCFFHLVSGASLGTIIPGRKGATTRISFVSDAISKYVAGDKMDMKVEEEREGEPPPGAEAQDQEEQQTIPPSQIIKKTLGQGIFIAHGKNKDPLEKLKKILGQFKIPYKVAIEEPSLGRPISSKVREIMNSCNCAILIFTTDEEFRDVEGNTIWRPSENVVHELGAAAYLYDNRIVIMKEEGVEFPSNFKDIGYISFKKDQLDAKTMDILKELIGFGIVKIST